MTPNPIWQRSIDRIIQTIIILVVLYYTLLGGFFVGVHEARWRLITYLIGGLLLGSWLVKRLLQKKAWRRTPLDRPLVAVIVAAAAATFTSTDPRLSLGWLLMILIYGLFLFYALDLVRNPGLTEKIINAILLTALVVCLVGLFEYWQWLYGDWLREVNHRQANLPWSLGLSRRIKSVLHNPNILAYYLLPVLGLSLYKFSAASRRRSRLAWMSWTLLAAIIIFLTQSRGGLLGAIVTLGLFISLSHFVSRKSASSLLKTPLTLRHWGVLVGVGGLIALLLLPLLDRSFGMGINWGQRDDIWPIALKTMRQYPWLGSGPGTFGQQYLTRRTDGSDFIHSHAHNLWLTLGAETGLIGLAAIGWLNLAFIKTMPRVGRGDGDQPRQNLAIAALAALAGMSSHNLVDDFLDYPMLTFHAIFLVACCLNVNRGPPQREPGRWSTALNGLAAGLVLTIGGTAFWFLPAFMDYDRARLAAGQGNWSEAAGYLEQAVASDPGYRFYRQQLALTYGLLASSNDPLASEAVALQEALLHDSDHYPLDRANLACFYQQANDPLAAITAMARAAKAEPARTRGGTLRVSRLAYQFSLVQLYEQLDKSEPAQELLVQILVEYPWMAASPFWSERSDRLRQLLDRLEHTAALSAADLAALHYYGGNYDRAAAISRQRLTGPGSDVSSLIYLGRALLKMDQSQAALEALNQALTIAPYHAEARLVRAQILAAQDRLDAAETDLQISLALAPKSESYTLWGQLAEKQGALTEAKQRYRQAIFLATRLETNYAHLVGRREPLPAETMPCLLIPYTEDQLSRPALALGRLLEEEQNLPEAEKIYHLAWRYEPYNPLIQAQLLRTGR